ncbi:MAG: class I SAM-dependent methyltransferase [Eubacteriales bacterium]|nr:class I SAM-dependent methyltransferase [Eubacteriales bacterium]
MDYQEINASAIDKWCREGWQWGQPVSHETFVKAQCGQWDVLLTPTKPVPHSWFGQLAGKKLLGLASGGGQQIPIFTALGASCTVLDYSPAQCDSEKLVARREGYDVTVIRGDMTKPLPFASGTFDIIFHPVSNCYVEKVEPIFAECFRILKQGGVLLCGLDNGMNYIFDEQERELKYPLPFNPLKNRQQYEDSIQNDWGIQFSHTIEEQLGGQLKAGFRLTDIFEDTNGEGRLHEFHVPTFFATRAVKE